SMILAVSDLLKPRLRRKSVRSSSVRATMRSRADLMPLTNGMGEELAKRVSAGAALWAKREGANFEWRMVISSKSLDTPEVTILADGPQIEARDSECLRADLR